MKNSYTELLQKAAKWIEEHKEEFISELRTLVQTPSVSCAEEAKPNAPFGLDCRRVLDKMMERGRFYGFDVEDHDGYAVSVSIGDPTNSIGMIAHLDVVPVGDGWVYPPFDVTYLPENGALIGRGVADNKGPAVTGLFAMRMLKELNWPLKHGLRVIGGSSEETGMEDMKYLVEKGIPFPKISLVPDAAFPVNYAQKGTIDADLTLECRGNLIRFDAGSVRNVVPDLAECTLTVDVAAVQKAAEKLDEELARRLSFEACCEGTKVTARGRAGHAARPDNCVNAIAVLTSALCNMDILKGSCAKAIKEIAELTEDGFGISEGVAYEDEESGQLTLVYGVAHLKDGLLTVLADSRYSVTLDKEDISRRMKENWLKRGFTIAYFDATAPFYLPRNDAKVVALQELYKAVTGRDDEPYSMGGGTYSRAVPNAMTFGPGLRGVEHDMSFLPEGHGGGHGRDEVIFWQDVCTGFQIYAVALAMLDELME